MIKLQTLLNMISVNLRLIGKKKIKKINVYKYTSQPSLMNYLVK